MVPTYREIKERVYKRFGYKIHHDCCIAEVKREHSLTRGHAWNWGMGKGAPPCPSHIREAIENVLRECGSIK